MTRSAQQPAAPTWHAAGEGPGALLCMLYVCCMYVVVLSRCVDVWGHMACITGGEARSNQQHQPGMQQVSALEHSLV
jgi:hypothetical protein